MYKYRNEKNVYVNIPYHTSTIYYYCILPYRTKIVFCIKYRTKKSLFFGLYKYKYRIFVTFFGLYKYKYRKYYVPVYGT